MRTDFCRSECFSGLLGLLPVGIRKTRWHELTGGATRLVLITRRWAIKVPRFDCGWRAGLVGTLANIQEAEFGRLGWHELCPVRWASWGGLLIVMPRAAPLSKQAYFALDYGRACRRFSGIERKMDSFGIFDGRIVAVDYGSNGMAKKP